MELKNEENNNYSITSCLDIIPNNSGTSTYRFDTFSDSETNKDKINPNDCNNHEINVNIYRFKFTDEVTSELYKFSKIHQYDHRKDFKEAWNIWLEEQEGFVGEEVRRLVNLGYDGNVLDKMFKSARYYFRKKNIQKKEPVKRRVYRGVQKELLEAMDTHINTHINDDDYKPSEGFDHFCKENIGVVQDEVNVLVKNGFTDSSEIKNKIKKTYKNRYFLFISK
jgi:hypothetical protein